MNKKIEPLVITVADLTKKNEDINKKIVNVVVPAPNEAGNIVTGRKLNKTQSQIDIINTVSNESKEIEKREKNVSTFGLEESNKTDCADI